jgi:hypothetical protein
MNSIKSIWNAWRAFAKKVGTFQSQVLFGILYLVLFSIPGILSRVFFDLLKAKRIKKTAFSPWPHKKQDLTQAKMQF